MTFIRKIKRGNSVYYQEVENIWKDGKTVQRHIRYIGKDRDNPSTIPLTGVQFGYIATRLMQGDLSAHEVMDMIGKMGSKVSRDDLEKIGIHYDFKKNSFSLSLHWKRSPVYGKDAADVKKR